MSNIPKKPDDTIWNDEQWQAIYEKGHDLLISAGAGSGKTAVLVERIIQKILIDHINIDELLVLTFTEAAAAEMKQRIRAHPFNERNMDKNFHDRRQEKTAHADIKYGGDAKLT